MAQGCFWGVENYFLKSPLKKGILKSEVGYTGGQRTSPNYQQVRLQGARVYTRREYLHPLVLLSGQHRSLETLHFMYRFAQATQGTPRQSSSHITLKLSTTRTWCVTSYIRPLVTLSKQYLSASEDVVYLGAKSYHLAGFALMLVCTLCRWNTSTGDASSMAMTA